jgi:hypothetical protein
MPLQAKSGWAGTEGLGRNAEGRTEPIILPEKFGTGGLGYSEKTGPTKVNSMNGKHQRPSDRYSGIQDISTDVGYDNPPNSIVYNTNFN